MSYRIMLADDEPIMRKALLTLTDWEALDCQVVYTATNGQEVLEHLKESRPDILITDIKMPGSDGIEIAKYIWEKKLPIKVIVLTAYADFSYAQSAVKYGVSDYITKTGMFDGLVDAIENAKKKIEEEKNAFPTEDRQLYLENTLKAVFDGSLYEEEEIEARMQKLGLELTDYYLVMLQYGQTGKRQDKKGRDTHKSLTNFLHMVFARQQTQVVAVDRDCFAIVLEGSGSDYERSIWEKCRQIIDMMENYMQYEVCIVVSGHHQHKIELKAAYEETYPVLKESTFTGEKILLASEQRGKEGEGSRGADGKHELVQACLDYIDKHYESCVQVSEIAREIGTSSSYLSRIFKEEIGQTIISTLNEKKRAAAIKYLTESDLKVYEIAERLGFENSTYFSHFFKKSMGISPRDYKRNVENGLKENPEDE